MELAKTAVTCSRTMILDYDKCDDDKDGDDEAHTVGGGSGDCRSVRVINVLVS